MKVSNDRANGPRPVPAGLIDFTAARLPEYEGCYAIVLDSLLSKPELSSILEEAERQPWQVAQVNAGTLAFTNTSYRNGQRIIYDSFELSRKIFDKVRPHLSAIEEIEEPVRIPGIGDAVQKWRMVRMNERLRFLRYPKGGFFCAHVDGCYENEANGQRTFYTLQLYLPSDTSGSAESFVPVKGGTTRFWGDTGREYADVEALPGRVLVFQHDTLEHTGEEVVDGVKCAMRSDILYEMIGDPIPVSPAVSA